MSLSGFVLFVLGALVELILLYTAVNGETVYEIRSWLDRILTPSRSVILVFSIMAILIIGIFELFGIGKTLVYIDTPLVGIIFGLVALLILGICLLLPGLFLPILNEQAIGLTQVLVLVGAWWGGEAVVWLPPGADIILPAVVILLLVLVPKGIPPAFKAILYFWYLLSLLAIPFQSGEVGLFQQGLLSWAECFSFGILSVFLLLHILLALRFFLIVSSLLRPSSHALVKRAMPRFFTDEQIPALRFAGVALLITVLLAANFYTGLLSLKAALSLSSALGVQLLSFTKPASASSQDTSPGEL